MLSAIAYCISPYASFYAGLSCYILFGRGYINIFNRLIYIGDTIPEFYEGGYW